MELNEFDKLALDIHLKVESWVMDIEQRNETFQQLQQETDEIVNDYYNTNKELSRV